MTRVNIDILGISELRWTGMGEFNSDDHYIYYYGQEFLRKNGAAMKRDPHVQGKRKPSKMVGTERRDQRADRLKLQSQTTS